MPPFIPELDDKFSLQYFKKDNKIQMYNNPFFEFDMKKGAPMNATVYERKFNPLGNFQIKKINKIFEDF